MSIKLHIGEGKGIDIDFPVSGFEPRIGEGQDLSEVQLNGNEAVSKENQEDKVLTTLKTLVFDVKEIRIGEETTFANGILTVRQSLTTEAVKVDPIVKKVEMDVINPDNHDIYTNTMMDVCPIATKTEGKIGEGVTYELGKAIMVLTGIEEGGLQVSDANSSDGIFGERVFFNRPGSPDEGDIVLRINVIIETGRCKERPGPFAAHKAADFILEEIREVLKKADEKDAANERITEDIARPSKPRVVLVKEIMGQGAMHDNLILPEEPAGFEGGRPNVDLGNLPVLLTPSEVLDGGIHALTCITPDTKETTRAYYREPFVERMMDDPEFNLVGVVFVGSPQANTEKFYVSDRLGRWIEALHVEGAIVTTEGFGNNHIDFASHIEEIGSLGVPVVGVSYCGVQGALVVGNKYMDALVDLAVSEDGCASDRIGENSVSEDAALRAVAMLKNKMMGIPIEKPESKWFPDVQDENLVHAKESHKE
ncbi:MAG: D-proline reductase (dithiol) proprotein PrdA [Lachnospiraceae bacterium]|nr:D-proline reductase (dithiol) proprotein PrdA [Lachnospiraceae bacterium]